MRNVSSCRAAILSLVLLLTLSGAAQAQAIPDIGSTGIREPARMSDELLGPDGPGALAGGGSIGFLVPGFIHVDGADMFGITLGLVDKARLNGLPLQLRAGYRRMETEASGFNQLILDGKIKMKRFDFGSEIAINGKYQQTMDASTRLEAGGAIDHLVKQSGDRKLSVGGSAAYRLNKLDGGGPDESGLVLSVSSALNLNGTLSIEPAYEFNTTITGVDSYTVALVKAFPTKPMTPVAVLVGGKGQLASLSLILYP